MKVDICFTDIVFPKICRFIKYIVYRLIQFNIFLKKFYTRLLKK